MTKTFKKSVAFLSAVAMVMAMLLYFPSGIFSNIDFGITVFAEENGYDNGFCTEYEQNGSCTNTNHANCNGYQPATLTNDKHDIDGVEGFDEVYEISNAGQLYWFAGLVNGTLNGVTKNKSANAVLTNDITVNSNVLNANGELNNANIGDFTNWTPIGNEGNQYTGTFDGQNHTISGLYFDDTNIDYVGLFGYVGNVKDVNGYYVTSAGKVSNVVVVDSYFEGKNLVGGVCGKNAMGKITNCYNKGAVSGTEYVGGVCGFNNASSNGTATIENCYNTGNVSGTSYVGGVCGQSRADTGHGAATAKIENCNNTGNVSGTGNYVGGVCGNNDASSHVTATIENCYNTGNVSGSKYVGGVCGFNNAASDETSTSTSKATITNCHNTGAVSGTGNYVGGVCGKNENGTITDCYNAGEVSGSGNEVGGVCGTNHAYNLWGTAVKATIENCYNTGEVSGSNWVGGVCGFNNAASNGTATIINCYNTESVTGGENVGGVCGFNNAASNETSKATIENCHNIGSVTGTGEYNVGGVCGENYANSSDIATITNCYNEGAVSGTGNAVGGVCGYNNANSNGKATITNCYNRGTVSGLGSGFGNYIGGVCGHNKASSTETTTITNCYNTGSVKGNANVGGVCGWIDGGTISNCYNAGAVSVTDNYVGGVCGENWVESSKTAATITNCYYLNGTADKGIGQYKGEDEGSALVSAEPKPLEDLCKLDLDDEGTAWTAGSVPNEVTDINDRFGKKVYTLPSLIGVGSAQTISVDVYNFSTNETDDWQDYISIRTVEELKAIGNDSTSLGKNYVLMEDIDLKDITDFTPIGTSSNPFTGKFSGNGHKITNLTINKPNENYIGLFGFSKGTIMNVGIEGGSVTGGSTVGGVCGRSNGTISNCYNTASVTGTIDDVGGVCGYNCAGTISNCYNTGVVSGNDRVGGVCGYNEYGTIANCYNTGNVSGSSYVGGVCGYNSSGSITNCYNRGTVSGSGNSVGGVCGNNSDGTIANCYFDSKVYNGNAVGNNYGTVSENVLGKETTQFTSGEVAYLLSQGCTVDSTIYNGDVWGQKIGTDNYPVLGSTFKVSETKGCVTYNNDNNSGEKAHNFTIITTDTHKCKDCGMAQKHNFTYLNDSQHKCSVCDSAVAHSGGTATCLKKAECEICNEEYGELAEEHSYVDGYCELCNKPEHQHAAARYVRTNVVESTCTEYGSYTRLTYCSCGQLMSTRYFLTLPKEHDYSSGGICKTCSTLKNGKDGFKSASLTLTDGVIINYNLLLSDTALADTKAYIHFTSPQGLDVKTMLSEGVEDSGKYKFSLKLRPDQMADVVTAQVVYSDGSKGNSVDYSVTKYADNVKNNADSATSKTSDLIDAMLYYGAATQSYTGNNTDNSADENISKIFDSNVKIADDYKMSLNGTVNGIKIKGASLIAGSLTTIKVKYQVTEGSISDFTFTCDGVQLTPVKEGNYYYVYISDISPDNIDKMYSIVVTDKNGNSRTLEYSALTYAKSIIEDTTGKYPESLVNMMKALYYYNKAADAYSN